MAYSTIDKSSSFMNPKIYTGTNLSNAITGVGFAPAFTWIKTRTLGEAHILTDVVRGATKTLSSNVTDEQTTNTADLTSFDSDGFTVGTNNRVNNSNMVAWNWKAGTTSGLSGGTITPSSYSINATSGFGIYKWTGTGTAGTITHGLGSTPKMMIVKAISGAPGGAQAWSVYHEALGATKIMHLNNATVPSTQTDWNDTSPTSTVFSVGTANRTNAVGGDYIAYVFANVSGYSKFGSYKGNGNVDGPFVYLGFKPSYLVFKNTTTAGEEWKILDSSRDPINRASDKVLVIEQDVAESDATNALTDFVANGFKIRSTHNAINKNGSTFIYWAFGQPIISNSGTPATAR